MLTRSQIQRLAQRYGIGLQAQERDYIQHILLYALYHQTQHYFFKGGTALRIVFHSNRYSEDLDFNCIEETSVIDVTWDAILRRLEDFGVMAAKRNAWHGDASYSFDISYQGPLYDGRERTKGKVRVDLSLRNESLEFQRNLISPEYDDLRPFVLTVLKPGDLLAEKMRALFVRGKARDVYDIWLLTQQGVKLDVQLVNTKLTLYDLTFSQTRFEEALMEVKTSWERELRPLLPQFVAWEDVERSLRSL